jgi:hypothetical protein
VKILLDIDGVMVSAKPWQTCETGADGFCAFSKFSVEGLNRILVASANPEIILTTSHKNTFTLQEWESIFSTRGVLKTKIGRLVSNNPRLSRYEEIKHWHSENEDAKFIILDDDRSLNAFETSFKEAHLVMTNPTVGLTSEAADDAIQKVGNLLDKVFP